MLPAGLGNQEGFWENKHLMQVNEAILLRLGGKWDIVPDFPLHWAQASYLHSLRTDATRILAALQQRQPWGWKDPRNSITLPFWKDLIPNLHLVWCIRHPSAVARSLLKRDGIPLATGLELWYDYNVHLLQAIGETAFIVCDYDAFFVRPGIELNRLLGFVQMASQEQVVAEAMQGISQRLRHYHNLSSDGTEPGLAPHVELLYLALCAQAESYGVSNRFDIIKQAEIESETHAQRLAAKPGSVLFVSHTADRNNATLWLLNLLRWLRQNSDLRFRVLLHEGGQLEKEFHEVAETYSAENFQPARGLLTDVELIYSNTLTNGVFLEGLPCARIPIITQIHESVEAIALLDVDVLNATRRQTCYYTGCSQAVCDLLVATYGIAPQNVTQNSFDLEEARPKWLEMIRNTLSSRCVSEPAELPESLRLAQLDLEKERLEEALSKLGRALAETPNNMEALVLAARCYTRVGDVPRARKAIMAALRVSPRHRQANQLLRQIPLDGPSLEHLSACPACTSTRFTMVFEHVDGILPLRLHQCEQCELVFMNPRLTRNSNMHLENVETVCPYSAEDLSEEVGKRVELLRSFEQYKRPPGHMIDVGCGRGLLLEAARLAGWEPFGLDPSSTAVKQARSDFGLLVSNEPLETLMTTQLFDLCVAWHVFEHCLSPRNFLAHLHRLLAKNGVLALQVPSYSCLAEFAARNRLSSLVNKVHNLYLTTATLGRLLTGAGFQILNLIEGQDLMLTAFAQKQT